MSRAVQHSNKSAHLVAELRQRFLEDYDNNPGLYNEDDVERIRSNDWLVKRFLLARSRNVNQAFEMIRNTFRWRQEFGLPTMKDEDFPLEFYKVGGIFPYEKDKDGNMVIYLRIRMHRKIAELAEPIKKFLMHIVNKVDGETDGSGMAIVFDCSGAGYSNMDMDFLGFLIHAGNNYFPVGLKYILVYELSWLLNAFRRMAMSLIPQSFIPLVKFANKNDVINYIPLENLPDFMGGHCKRDYRYIPEGCTTVAKLAIENGYTQADINRILPIFEPLLEEADKAIAERKSVFGDNRIVQNVRLEELGTDSDKHDDNDGEDKENICSLEDTDNGLISLRAQLRHFGSFSRRSSMTKTKPLSEVLGVFPDDILYLQYDSHIKTYQCNILLQNLSSSAVAYKIQSNNPSNYWVSPRLGIILVGASLRCNIQMIADRQHKPRDSFLVLAVPLSDNNKLDATQFSSQNSIEDQNESKELKEQVMKLRKRCDRMETTQSRLQLLLNALLVVIFVFIAVVMFDLPLDRKVLRIYSLFDSDSKCEMRSEFKT